MRFASLGSGSEGNALLVEASSGTTCTRVLLDCGFGIKETERRLARLDCAPTSLHGLLVTHEHADHIGSAYGFALKYHLPIYLSHGTYLASPPKVPRCPELVFCRADSPFELGDLAILPYTVPHDAREPLQFVLTNGAKKLGVLTDTGMATPYLVQHLQALDALVLECNHDRQMLEHSAYPASLKRRIGGDFGHLANDIAAQILQAVLHPKLQHVVAAHLSQQNNRLSLVQRLLAEVLGALPDDIQVASQDEGLAWCEL